MKSLSQLNTQHWRISNETLPKWDFCHFHRSENSILIEIIVASSSRTRQFITSKLRGASPVGRLSSVTINSSSRHRPAPRSFYSTDADRLSPNGSRRSIDDQLRGASLNHYRLWLLQRMKAMMMATDLQQHYWETADLHELMSPMILHWIWLRFG